VANIQERLLAAFGPDHGLQLDSAPGEGTTVTIRIPKLASHRRTNDRRESA
jgi:two-component system LytT family sensor kinase